MTETWVCPKCGRVYHGAGACFTCNARVTAEEEERRRNPMQGDKPHLAYDPPMRGQQQS